MCATVCCSVVQCVAVCCSVLQCVALRIYSDIMKAEKQGFGKKGGEGVKRESIREWVGRKDLEGHTTHTHTHTHTHHAHRHSR